MMRRPVRIVLAALAPALIAGGIWFIFATPQGAALRDDPKKLAADFQGWVSAHGVWAPAVFIGVYVLAALCMVPVWWLQLLAGAGFGLWAGIAWSLAGAVSGSAAGCVLSRAVAADWFHARIEGRREKLRQLDEKMGHNGLLIVMAIRLMHVLPFGLSNYLLGVSRISLADVVVGTLLGNIPSIALYVGAGAGINPLHNWRFVAALVAVNVLLLAPVALRYWKPGWFRKIGIE